MHTCFFSEREASEKSVSYVLDYDTMAQSRALDVVATCDYGSRPRTCPGGTKSAQKGLMELCAHREPPSLTMARGPNTPDTTHSLSSLYAIPT